MTKPVRLQLSRKRGFNLQALSIATNGLPAVNVARPSNHGNPFKVGQMAPDTYGGIGEFEMDAETCVRFFRHRARRMKAQDQAKYETWIKPLRGRNLACFCAPDAPCHADVLLKLCEEVS